MSPRSSGFLAQLLTRAIWYAIEPIAWTTVRAIADEIQAGI